MFIYVDDNFEQGEKRELGEVNRMREFMKKKKMELEVGRQGCGGYGVLKIETVQL